tara:strand:- start:184 stop:462 length:279 start_codon:yes stop_codon:yes gene_type:complete
MTFKQIQKLAEQLGVVVHDDFYWDSGFWYCDIDAPKGKSFSGCDYHFTTFPWEDKEKTQSISTVRGEFAKYIKFEATEIGDCHCDHWNQEEE